MKSNYKKRISTQVLILGQQMIDNKNQKSENFSGFYFFEPAKLEEIMFLHWFAFGH